MSRIRNTFVLTSSMLALAMPLRASPAELSPATLSLAVQALDGAARVFPRDASVPRSIFVITFSSAATDAASEWTRRLREMAATLEAPIFQVAILEDVPRLLRGAVTSAMSRGIPTQLHSRFWVADSAGAQWRRLAEASSDAEPHVMVLDDRERVTWRAHGKSSDAALQELLALPRPLSRQVP